MMTINAMYQTTQEVAPLIGKIEYLDTKGRVAYYTNYFKGDEETFKQDIKDELEWDVAIAITLYSNKRGKTVNIDFVNKMKYRPQDIQIAEPMSLVRL